MATTTWEDMGSDLSTDGGDNQHNTNMSVRLLNNDVIHKYNDVIIAFVDTSWDPKSESLQVLFKTGGNRFFSEWENIREHKIDNCQIGDVFATHPGDLPCRYVLFPVLKEVETTETDDEQISFVVKNMLQRATQFDDVTSVAVLMGHEVGLETNTKVLNNVFLWLMALRGESINHVYFLALNPVIKQTLNDALQNFKDEVQRQITEVADASPEVRTKNETDDLQYLESRSEYSTKSSSHVRRLSRCSIDEEILPLIKSVEQFPEHESIWMYYTSSLDHFFRTFQGIRSISLSQCSLDHDNFQPKIQQFFCSICQSNKTSSERILSKCGHKFCSACIDRYFKDISPSCPNCKTFYGEPLGNQPDGIRSYKLINEYLPGYQGTDTIIIEYDIPDGIQTSRHPNPGQKYKGTHRRAYLPDNEQGRRVHGMLQRAFDRKLIFTVGRSVTTGKENVVTWNDIHHKTRPSGGPERYGYPDPEYLDRVEEQLRKAGITDEGTY